MKKTIIHLIVNLGRGGAETTLVRVLKELHEFRNIVVTMEKRNEFPDELVCDKYICMNLKPTVINIIPAAIKLNQIIKKYNADIFHSQLTLMNFIARLATPASVPLVTTIHTSSESSKDYKKSYMRLLDRYTYNHKASTIIGCSEGSLNEYFSFLKLKRKKSALLYNFVDVIGFNIRNSNQSHSGKFRMVTVGSLKIQKNLFYLVEAMSKINNENVELHIYGKGPLQKELELAIEEKKAPIILHGEINNIKEVLAQYDLYVMASSWEGFSLSVLEAAAAKLPLLLSDIPSFREQASDCAIYFDLNSVDDFVEKFRQLRENKDLQQSLANKANQRILKEFTLERHLATLRDIYDKEIN